jgi:iron complex transport system permease protein
MAAAAVAVAGMIGFVGLVVPHMMRLIVGPDHRYLIPASALGGASILLLTDAAARTLIPPLEIPVGALTALLGAPYFLYLLKRRKDAGEF